ncbi:hypothetical protein GBAR_LOCUS23076 [Geodia barretti]|uniref:Uncharacterized protein n=1 Tax=Geodia barretti TaxID=519541 RepID=A0AA35X167_GEOBA|nr:hypothetical protein GBAR_LOCUS23076 [Geodia barretti]
MALRDLAGVLTGLRKVAAAVCAEATSELQNSLSRTPAPSSLYKTASQGWIEYGELKWAGKWSNGGGFDKEFFPEWGEQEDQQLFPMNEPSTGSISSGSLHHDTDGVTTTPLPQQLGANKDSPIPPPPPASLDQNPVGTTSRESHTQRRAHLPRQPASRGGSSRRWFHSSTRYGNETVAGGGSRSRSEGGTLDSAAKEKHPKPKQKLSSRARERAVPATRVSRLFSFGGELQSLTAIVKNISLR